MPKGALLHAHLDATVNAEFLLELALKQPAVHLRITKPLLASPLSENLPEFRILPQAQSSQLKSLSDISCTPGSWVSLRNARTCFPTQLGGQEGFDKWVIGSMTINPAEAYGTHNTVTRVCCDARSFDIFDDRSNTRSF
jgi:adenosine deaminase CECR1